MNYELNTLAAFTCTASFMVQIKVDALKNGDFVIFLETKTSSWEEARFEHIPANKNIRAYRVLVGGSEVDIVTFKYAPMTYDIAQYYASIRGKA